MGNEEGVNTEGKTEGLDSPPDEEIKEKKHEESVPFVRFNEVNTQLNAEKEARIRAEERLKALEESKKPETKVFTRTELLQMVRDEKITQEQADEYWETALTAKIKADVAKEFQQTETTREGISKIKADMAKYRELVPDVLKDGTEARNKVAAEYQSLVALGHPADVRTEYVALKAVFGPVEKLEKKTVTHERESFQDVGGGKGDKGGQGSAHKNLPPRYKNHYQGMIDKGMYSGWDDPRIKKELDRMNKKDPDAIQRRAKKYA